LLSLLYGTPPGLTVGGISRTSTKPWSACARAGDPGIRDHPL